MKILILSLLSLVACGHTQCEFESYVDQFRAVAVQQGRPDLVAIEPNIRFATEAMSTEPNRIVVGQCFQYSNGYEIVIKREFWDLVSETARTLLIFHELGHCVLNRQHEERRPSIMMPVNLPADATYEANKVYYLKELFHPKPVALRLGY